MLFLICNLCSAVIISHPYDHEGPVKSIRYKGYYYKENPESTYVVTGGSSYYEYNESGKCILDLQFYDNDSIQTKSVSFYSPQMEEKIKYNFDGKIISKQIIKFDSIRNEIENTELLGDGTIYYQWLSKYDIKGNKIEASYSGEFHGSEEIVYYGFDDKNRKNRQNSVTNKTTIEYRDKYRYDENGRVIEHQRSCLGYSREDESFKYYADGTIKEKSYYLYFKKDLTIKAVHKYNTLEQEIERNIYTPSGELLKTISSQYDSQNNIIEIRSYDFQSKFVEVFSHTYKYDENNNILEHNYFEEDGNLYEKEIYTYQDTFLIETQEFNFGNLSPGSTTTKYDLKGNIIESIVIDINENIVKRSEYKYDEFDNEIEERSTNPYRKFKLYQISTYDENNNLIELFEEQIYDDSTCYHTSKFEYDDSHNKVKSQYYYIKEKMDYDIFVYDSNRNVIEYREYNNYNKLLRNKEYIYDDSNELLEELEYDNNILTNHSIYRNGLIVEELNFLEDGNLEYSIKHEYDKYGNEILEEVTYPGEKYFPEYTYEYDTEGNKIVEVEYNSDGTIKNKTAYQYDGKKNKIEELDFNSDGKLLSKRNFRYNDKQKCIHEDYWNFEYDYKTTKLMKYNNNNKKIEEAIINDEGNITHKKAWRYNENNKLIEKCRYEKGQLKEKITYEYFTNHKIIEHFDNYLNYKTYKHDFLYDKKRQLDQRN